MHQHSSSPACCINLYLIHPKMLRSVRFFYRFATAVSSRLLPFKNLTDTISPFSASDCLARIQKRLCATSNEASPASIPLGKFSSSNKVALGFTCKPCGERVNRYISRSSYTKGVVLVRCPGCRNVHLIADHLGWFRDLAPGVKTIEDIAASKGEVVRKHLEVDELFEVNDSTDQPGIGGVDSVASNR